jgi:sugar lactone lactonase YvrE
VAQGPDGFLYVGTLAFGANFATGTPQSKVYRVNPNSQSIFLTDADVWASGFSPITGCGFGPGAFYVTEFFTFTPPSFPGDVIRIALNPDGSAGARTPMGVGALIQPNGFAAGPDGSIYVSNFSTFPGISNGGPVGQVVRVDY